MPDYICMHLYKMTVIGKFIKTEKNGLVIDEGWGGGEKEKWLLSGTEFLSELMQMLGLDSNMLFGNVLKATELFTLMRWISCM